MKKIFYLFLPFIFSACCIPIMGPCGQNDFFFPGSNVQSAVVVSSDRAKSDWSNLAIGTTYVNQIYSLNPAAEPVTLEGPTSNLHLPPGRYKFYAFSVWDQSPQRMGPVPVGCYDDLKPGKYQIKSVRRFVGGTAFFYVIIQNANKQVVCLSGPDKPDPVPMWVNEILRTEK